ncbi:hypothetical protein V9T40_013696 [Parthenolecanium corni]|uniref:Peptidase S1 domain-containing protein n=1 Tax=Parthenolecanium corni TaxID=536013 RepID=A0AAN9Y2V2_9HEMI
MPSNPSNAIKLTRIANMVKRGCKGKHIPSFKPIDLVFIVWHWKNDEITACITVTFPGSLGGPSSYRQKPRKPVTNGTIITTRFGDDGSPKEQCQCISFWLCDATKLYDDPNDPKPCGDPQLVCCKQPYFDSPESFGNHDSTYLSDGYQTCSEGVCVESNECKNYGAGKLDFRTNSCSEHQVCCPKADVIKKETNENGTPPPKEGYTPGTDKPSSELTGGESSKPSCVCVPPTHCVNYGQGILQMRLSKCGEHEICCSKVDIIVPPGPTEIPSFPSKPKYECGYKKGDPLANRIANTSPDENSEFGEFPWMSLILKKTSEGVAVVCGASLLAADLLLTAAHCVDKIDKESLIIRVGEHDTYLPSNLEKAPHEDGYVADIYIPNNYRADVAFNDLAIIKVKEPFQFRENVVPICSPLSSPEYGSPDIYDPHRCLATGWGKDAYSKSAKLSKVLKKVDLLIVPNEECQRALRKTRLGSTFTLHESFICAGGQPGKDTCKGDGGGPLICALKSDPTRYVQVGVTSWGIDCAKNYPAVYASVLYNKDWLRTEPNLHSIFERRSIFSDCPIGMVKCPPNKVLPNVISTTPSPTSAPSVAQDCSCTPPVYCNADFGANTLQEKMFQCDLAEICCPTDLIQTVLDVSTQPPSTTIECGIKKEVIYNKLAGAAETVFGEFPWMVVILERENNKEKVKCGASLVSTNLVLTAAHCVQ